MNTTAILIVATIAALVGGGDSIEPGNSSAQPDSDYRLFSVPKSAVELDDGFWADRLKTNATATVRAVFDQCESTGRLSNFSKAAGHGSGEFDGYFFNDSDVYKAIEGAAYILATAPDDALERRADSIIDDIAAAQEASGYLNTYYTLEEPDEKWSNIGVRHELYCAGHLLEAAVAYHHATGKRKLLDVAIRLADHIDATFGPGKRTNPPGHQEIEIGLVKLYRHTGESRYLELAEFFIDQRGVANGRELYGLYAQDHKPVVEQDEAVGHAVRAAYLYAGMADVAALRERPDYVDALDRLWHNVVSKKMYITGGIGASRAGEAFGGEYELPNESSYAETCGAIANALWNDRMLRLTADAKYADVLERVIYNGFLVGVSLSGDRFFYPNPLETDGVTPFNHGSNERSEWFECACCPVNVVRFVPSIAEYIYAHDNGSNVYVNLFADGTANIETEQGEIRITQETDYPWNGRIRFTVESNTIDDLILHVRVPGWAMNAPVPSDLYTYTEQSNNPPTLTIDGDDRVIELHNGYTRITGPWNSAQTTIEYNLPMPVRRVVAHEKVESNAELVALERGPIVYCIEAVDHDGHALNIAVPDDAKLSVENRGDLLGGVSVITTNGHRKYRDEAGEIHEEDVAVTAIPYYAWNHRGPGEMTVWIPRSLDAVDVPPPPTIASRSRASASHTWSSDTPWAMNDQDEPASSADESIPRQTWWPRTGTTEWAQLNFNEPATVSAVEVYWFDDTGAGQCRTPAAWRLLYQDGDQWKPVIGVSEFGVEKDQFNIAEFPAIETTGLRIEVDLAEGFSGGILEWKVR